MDDPATVTWVVGDGGRRVAVYRLASGAAGRTIAFCHPGPGAGNFDPNPHATRARSVTLLSIDRPGFGQSDPVAGNAWASVGSAADDLAAALDQEGNGPFGLVGWSAGGRVALAIAARRPDLIDRVVVVGTPAPHEAVPWIPAEQVAAVEALRRLSPAEAHAALTRQLAPLASATIDPAAARALVGVSEVDTPVLASPENTARLDAMLTNAFAQGITGMVGDIAGYCLQPWGFEPEQVSAKTLLLYGARDPAIGGRHATWWHKRLPNSRVEMVPGAGHLLIFSVWERALSHLAPGLKVRGRKN